MIRLLADENVDYDLVRGTLRRQRALAHWLVQAPEIREHELTAARNRLQRAEQLGRLLGERNYMVTSGRL